MSRPFHLIASYLARFNSAAKSDYELLELEERVLYDASPLGVVAEELSQQEYTFDEQNLQELAEFVAAEGAIDGEKAEQKIVNDLLELDALINTADADFRSTPPMRIFARKLFSLTRTSETLAATLTKPPKAFPTRSSHWTRNQTASTRSLSPSSKTLGSTTHSTSFHTVTVTKFSLEISG